MLFELLPNEIIIHIMKYINKSALLNFIKTKVSNDHDAEDILQEVFRKIYINLDKVNDDNKLTSWMYQITRNVIIDYYRKHSPTEDIDKTVVVKEINIQFISNYFVISNFIRRRANKARLQNKICSGLVVRAT